MFAKISVEAISFAESERYVPPAKAVGEKSPLEGTGEDVVVASIDYFSG